MEISVFDCFFVLAFTSTIQALFLTALAGGNACEIKNVGSGTCMKWRFCEGAQRRDRGNSHDCLRWLTCCLSGKRLKDRSWAARSDDRGQDRPTRSQNSSPSSSSSSPPLSPSPPPTFSNNIPNLRIKGCGVRRSLTDFIVGGNESDYWPWMAAIFYRPQGSRNMRFQCGGTVISKNYILTAAHCLVEGGRSVAPNRVTVRLGGTTPRGNGHAFEVSKIKLHEDYRSQLHYNDIAVLELAETIESKMVVPACLPSPGMYNSNYYRRNATVTGWGLEDSSSASLSRTLREAKLPVFPNSRCNRRYRRLAALSLPRGIIDTQLCAGSDEGRIDACQGDSGGPLVLEDQSGKWNIIGIVSFGYGCAEPEYPGVYTRVAKFLPWLLYHTDIPDKNRT